LRICLLNGINGDHDAPQSAAFTKKLAYELAAHGHVVHVIFSDPNLLSNSKTDNTDKRIGYHAVDLKIDTTFNGRFMQASPQAHTALSQAFLQWQTFIELHKQTPFDVLDAGDNVLSALMPAMGRVVPTVLSAHEQMALFKAPKLIFEPLNFDLQLLSMLERLSLNLVDRISISSNELAQQLNNTLRGGGKIDLIDGDAFTASKIAQYQQAIESGQHPKKAVTYLKPATSLSTDALLLFRAYDEMLYNFLYQNSYRFRFVHWWNMLKTQPELFQSKLKQFFGRARGLPH
jgi:hypothetical protein